MVRGANGSLDRGVFTLEHIKGVLGLRSNTHPDAGLYARTRNRWVPVMMKPTLDWADRGFNHKRAVRAPAERPTGETRVRA